MLPATRGSSREAERLAHVGHWEWDLDSGRFEFIADKIFAIYGVVREEWKGDVGASSRWCTQRTASLLMKRSTDTRLRGTAELEHRIVRPDGEVRFVHESTEAFRDAEGRVVRMVGTCQDVTDQKAAEMAAEERSHFLEELLAAIPVPVHYKDASLHYVGCNDAFATSLGRSRKRSSAGPSSRSTRPSWPSISMLITANCLPIRSRRSRTSSVDGPGRDPSRGANPQGCLSDVTGRPAGIVAVDFDLTEMRRTQQDLAATAEQLALTLNGAVTALGATTEMRDPYTAGHQRRVAELACAIALVLGWNESLVEPLRIAALLHDIGKIVVPAEILSKPTRLTDPEMQLIRQHADAGANTVALIGFKGHVAEIIRQHHERLDGSGYPAGLRGSRSSPRQGCSRSPT